MTVLAIRDLTLRIAGRALLEGADLVVWILCGVTDRF